MKELDLSVPDADMSIDPIAIFNKLTLRGGIENTWGTQEEALKEWHEKHRDNRDVVLQMNTGGGKTLVGLLMAQSLANECDGRVLYVCANNQLIDQTKKRADEIGLVPAKRYLGEWFEQVAFESGETFCLTNYHGLFNGRSVFRNQPVEALIFDDAHVAESAIRGCFTLKLPRKHRAFSKVADILRKHFKGSSQATQFEKACSGEFTPVIFVPMYVVWQRANEIRKILVDNGVHEDESTKFAWSHLDGHFKHCCIFVTGAGLEITPLSLPLGSLPYFSNEVRRIFLTATLPSLSTFARTFGVNNPEIISPSGKSGDAQKLLVFVPGKDDDEQREAAKELIADKKSCIISPSSNKAKQWVPPSNIYTSDSGQDEIERFCNSPEPEMLGLVARYDGIDLPGKSCNVLILDRLPTGESLIDRFVDEAVKVETIRLSQTATRIVQAIGRIFRSNTDHGVVIAVGPQLQSWLRTKPYQRFLPPRLQQQIQLANAFQKQIDGEQTTWNELIEGILSGDEAWDKTYKKYIEEMPISDAESSEDWYMEILPEERDAYEKLWTGHPDQAADRFSQIYEKTKDKDFRLAAWYRHWHGIAALIANDTVRANHEFIQAANARSELGRPSRKDDAVFEPKLATAAGSQANALAAWYRTKRVQINKAIEQVHSDLVYGDQTSKAEEAMKVLGNLLGLNADRPDNAKNMEDGPDVLWVGEGVPKAWGFELKTDKDHDGHYTKTEIGQCHNHEQWMIDNYGKSSEMSVVGHLLEVSKQANPSDRLKVIPLDEIRDLIARVKLVYDSVEAGDKTDLALEFETWLSYYGLLWPSCVDALKSRLAIDLRSSED